MKAFVRIATAFTPLALAPALGYLIAEGFVNLGGGEKDLLWMLPWLLWSLVFAVSALVLWRRGWSLRQALVRSAMVGFSVILLAAGLLAIFSQLGVAGRF